MDQATYVHVSKDKNNKIKIKILKRDKSKDCNVRKSPTGGTSCTPHYGFGLMVLAESMKF
jgi:hypothetical protein